MSEKNYWSNYYTTKGDVSDPPSQFAKAVTSHFNTSISSVVEVGCGNGRDAYFLGKTYDVYAVDIANKPIDTSKCKFEQKSMEEVTGRHDLLYSRFSLHSVTESVEDSILMFAQKNCKYIAIEARSTKDELGQNKNEDNEARNATSYAAAHYRRYIDFEQIQKKLSEMNFEIILAEESNEFAPYKDQKPWCIRIIARCPNEGF